MPETNENTRRWGSYVCPGCRFVFRVQKGHDGEGVLCPNCRKIMKIPTSSDNVPPLTVASALAKEGKSRRVKTDGQQRRSRGPKSASWDQQAEASGAGKEEKRQMRTLLIGGTFLFLLVTGGVFALLHSHKDEPLVNQPAPFTEPKVETAKPPAERSGASYLAEVEPLTRKFMQATTVAEILPLVRNPAVAEERMRRYYPDGIIKSPGLSQFNTSGELSIQGKIVVVGVRTLAQEEKAIAFIETPQGLKIDWESWVVWSDMPWDQFMLARPTEGKVFRVLLSPVVYYNFEYTDDSKWKSYTLESPDHEHVIFGYVEKDSAVDKLIHFAPETTSISVTLSLKFNPNSTSKNQVKIDRVVADGWVENVD